MGKRHSNIGQLIRNARMAAGLTQSALGAELGYTSGQYVSEVERGLIRIPSRLMRPLRERLSIPIEAFAEAIGKDIMRDIVRDTTK